MAKNGGSRASAPGNNSSLILGILIGMVMGLAIAGGVAWHISKRPNPFQNKEQHDELPSEPAAHDVAKPAAAPTTQTTTAASGVNGKPRFEFYKILTDKEGATPKGSAHQPPAAPRQPSAAPATAGAATFLQVGSFPNASDADNLKAKLALLGIESNVQSADVPGKGMYYRVRLGPYHSADELNRANATLKQNGINDAAQVRAK